MARQLIIANPSVKKVVQSGGDVKNKRQSMADLKLRRLNELKLQPIEDPERPRIKVSEVGFTIQHDLLYCRKRRERLLWKILSRDPPSKPPSPLTGPSRGSNLLSIDQEGKRTSYPVSARRLIPLNGSLRKLAARLRSLMPMLQTGSHKSSITMKVEAEVLSHKTFIPGKSLLRPLNQGDSNIS